MVQLGWTICERFTYYNSKIIRGSRLFLDHQHERKVFSIDLPTGTSTLLYFQGVKWWVKKVQGVYLMYFYYFEGVKHHPWTSMVVWIRYSAYGIFKWHTFQNRLFKSLLIWNIFKSLIFWFSTVYKCIQDQKFRKKNKFLLFILLYINIVLITVVGQNLLFSNF